MNACNFTNIELHHGYVPGASNIFRTAKTVTIMKKQKIEKTRMGIFKNMVGNFLGGNFPEGEFSRGEFDWEFS